MSRRFSEWVVGLNFKAAILIVLTVPMLLALNLGLQRILEYRQVGLQRHEDARVFGASSELMKLVHELQKERTFGTVYLKTGGLEMLEEMLAQRKQTDKAVAGTYAMSASFNLSGMDTEAQEHFNEVFAALDNLLAVRKDITDLRFSPSSLINYYSGINQDALAFVKHGGEASTSTIISEETNALSSFSKGMELLSSEQAVAVSGMLDNAFSLENLLEYAGILKAQEAYFDIFQETIPEHQRTVLNDFAESADGTHLEVMRNNVISGGIKGELSGHTAQHYLMATGKFLTTLDEYQSTLFAEMQALIDAEEAAADAAIRRVILEFLVGVIFTVAVASAILRPLRAHIVKVCTAATELANDRLDIELPEGGRNEMGEIINSLSYLRQKSIEKRVLEKQIIAEERHKVEALERARVESDAIAKTVAHEINETTRALSKLAENGRISVQRLDRAHVENASMKIRAEKGNRMVQQAVDAMSKVSQSSKSISSITSTIEAIAFQTNLLALNARVEAARAGSAGKGFAVVAGEVQNLASRASRAASEISELMAKSNDDIENGVGIVNESGKVLKELAGGMNRVDETAVELRKSSVDQEASLAEIRTAATRLEEAMLKLVRVGDGPVVYPDQTSVIAAQ